MPFASPTFLFAFLPAVLIGVLLMRRIGAKNALLLAASLLFYAWGEPIYVGLMALSCLAHYAAARAITRENRRRIIAGIVVLDASLLGVFKYAGFLVSSVNGLLGTALPVPEIALPVGISFFTFQALSYVLDVGRGVCRAQRRLDRLLLYIALFPQLIAGPIVQYHDIDAELAERHVTSEDFARGVRRFAVGLSKKVLIADALARVADTVFALGIPDVNAAIAWAGAGAYALQIYFDFSGYSDMAIGMGWMLGFHFKENFAYPYAAGSLREFWRRWHISLTSWFRAYVYIPLGGNRKGPARTVLNKIAVFLLTGLWHGASWTFVVWGALHGGMMMLEELLPRMAKHRLWRWVTLIFVVSAFVVFRADTLAQGCALVGRMFTGFWSTPETAARLSLLLTPGAALAAAVGLAAATPLGMRIMARARALKPGRGAAALRALSYAGALTLFVLCALSLASASFRPFIYFRF